MTIFFHALTSGFYDTRAHGERTLSVADPAWQRPLIDVPDPAWKAPENNPEDRAPVIQVEDEKAQPPLIEVANPECTLPSAAELVEVTQDDYQVLFLAQSVGKLISAENGRPVAVDPPKPSGEQLKKQSVDFVQAHMDKAANTAGYDDIRTAVTYADEPAVARFQAEGQAFRAWRSLCWAYCYELLAAVEHGQRDAPSPSELIAELPPLGLPNG